MYRPYGGSRADRGWWAEWGLFCFVALVAAGLLLALAYPVLPHPDALSALTASLPDLRQNAPDSAVHDRIGALEAGQPAGTHAASSGGAATSGPSDSVGSQEQQPTRQIRHVWSCATVSTRSVPGRSDPRCAAVKAGTLSR